MIAHFWKKRKIKSTLHLFDPFWHYSYLSKLVHIHYRVHLVAQAFSVFYMIYRLAHFDNRLDQLSKIELVNVALKCTCQHSNDAGRHDRQVQVGEYILRFSSMEGHRSSIGSWTLYILLMPWNIKLVTFKYWPKNSPQRTFSIFVSRISPLKPPPYWANVSLIVTSARNFENSIFFEILIFWFDGMDDRFQVYIWIRMICPLPISDSDVRESFY